VSAERVQCVLYIDVLGLLFDTSRAEIAGKSTW
jgi:hypothetical protein